MRITRFNIKLLTWLVVISLSSMGFAQDFSATMTASGGGSDYGMTFGFNPSATDGYDDGIDS